MMSASLEKLPSYYLEEQVEIHENERHWIGGGFSKTGLLPNDRGRFSTPDGTLSWKTLEQAETALLGKGWTYNADQIESSTHDVEDDDDDDDDDDEKEDTGENTNGGGGGRTTSEWFYARDFTAFALVNVKTTRGTLDWVRFRRLTRTKVIDAEQFAPKEVISKCDYCDSDATDKLSAKLLDVLTYMTLVNGPSCLTAAVAMPAKTSIVDLLDPNRYIADTDTSKAATTSTDGEEQVEGRNDDDEHDDDDDNDNGKQDDSSACPALVCLGALHKSLEHLADTERNHPKHLLSHVGSFRQREEDPLWAERSAAVNKRFFSQAERDVMAGWMVRALDPGFQLHCNQKHCGEDSCPFFRQKCPNPGCPRVMSTVHLPNHDHECPYKLVRCECGDKILRQQQGQHLRSVCPLRDAKCPFGSIGCCKVLTAQSLPDHVADENSAHLLLVLDRLMEMQTVVRDLNGKIQRLETENTELKKQVETARQDATKQTKALEKKATAMGKKLDTLDSTTKKEFKKLKDTKSHVK